jgi:hypothetical protein
MTATLAAVIPTRNRASLAMSAVRSLIAQDCSMDIYVSDNSSSADAALRGFCERTPRVNYLRAPRELSMPEHWDWALRQVLQRSAATHLTLHHDRRFSKPRHWGSLLATASARPDLVISYPSDFINIEPRPRRLWQTPCTGKRFFIETARAARVMAAGQTEAICQAIPFLANCVVPRPVLESLIERYGSVCDSLSPDVAFMWRLFTLQERYIHHDAAPGVLYASHRSNGLSFMTGKGSEFPDYRKTYGDRPWLDLAPVPGLDLGHSMLYHEHAVVRRISGDALPPLDHAAVINELGGQLRWVVDPKRKARLRQLLEAHGWRGPDAKFPRTRTPSSVFQEWRCRFHMRWRGAVPPTITGFAFRSDRKALRFALRYPRQPQAEPDHLGPLDPVEMRVA